MLVESILSAARKRLVTISDSAPLIEAASSSARGRSHHCLCLRWRPRGADHESDVIGPLKHLTRCLRNRVQAIIRSMNFQGN